MPGPYWLFVESQNQEIGPVAPEFGDLASAATVASARSDLVRAATAPNFPSRWRVRPTSGDVLSDDDAAAWAALAVIEAFEVF